MREEWEHYEDSSVGGDSADDCGAAEKRSPGGSSAAVDLEDALLGGDCAAEGGGGWRHPRTSYILRDAASLTDALVGGDSTLLGRVVRSLSVDRAAAAPSARGGGAAPQVAEC